MKKTYLIKVNYHSRMAEGDERFFVALSETLYRPIFVNILPQEPYQTIILKKSKTPELLYADPPFTEDLDKVFFSIEDEENPGTDGPDIPADKEIQLIFLECFCVKKKTILYKAWKPGITAKASLQTPLKGSFDKLYRIVKQAGSIRGLKRRSSSDDEADADGDDGDGDGDDDEVTTNEPTLVVNLPTEEPEYISDGSVGSP